MAKIKDQGPYPLDEDIYVEYELQFKRDLIKPGIKIKFKGVRGHFIFRRVAHNARLDETWIDCIGVADQQFHAFYINRLTGVVKPKRSRRHKAIK